MTMKKGEEDDRDKADCAFCMLTKLNEISLCPLLTL